ncbi:transmembrane protein 273 isoform X1 [Equus przewalskii]|uniref:Transmembrane protein 273 n=2 Tax=Equus TaxID=9789 RepID=A0A9L0TC98_HORSE|nr:PREDICTED: putative uncharacterized protein C10orf128 homolog isoform X1 [Equus przewalskii]
MTCVTSMTAMALEEGQHPAEYQSYRAHCLPPSRAGHLPTTDAGGAQVLATGKSAGAETDIKYALIGTALGVAISAGFLVLKICLIKKHLWDNESTDQRSTNPDPNDTTVRKKRAPRSNLHFSERDAQVIEL